MQEQTNKLGNITRDKAKKSLGMSGGYIVCQRELVLDPNLSAGAKELFLIAWQLPQEFYLSETTLASYMCSKGFSITKRHIHRVLQELEQKGYISKVKNGYAREKGVTVPLYQYTLHEISVHLARDMLERIEQEIKQDKQLDVEF